MLFGRTHLARDRVGAGVELGGVGPLVGNTFQRGRHVYDTGRATTRAHPTHPLPARPYDTTNRPAQSVYRRGRGGCGRGDGALVAARPCPPSPLFSLFEMYCPLWVPAVLPPTRQHTSFYTLGRPQGPQP